MKISYTFLNIGVWNIHGLFVNVNKYKVNKLEDPAFLNRLHDFDILCLQETQCGPQDTKSLSVQGYSLIPFHRQKSANSRYFGGSVILIKSCLRKGVKVVESLNGDSIWLKLNKEFFHFEKDHYFNVTYASPSSSEYAKNTDYDIFSKLEEEVIRYRTSGNVIIGGDFNAKTETGNDFVSDQMDDHSPINNLNTYIFDNPIVRKNSDKHRMDTHGQRLLELCKNSQIRILNGRTRGDRTGKFTRYPLSLRENPSVLDYIMVDCETIKNVKYFSILPRLGLSDHECLFLSLRTGNFTVEITETKIEKERPFKYATVLEFTKKLNSPLIREKLKQFSINYSSSTDVSIEKMTEDLVDIMNISSASTNTYKN